ncbi:MAG TPA: matrixin family metalloprotease, partial [Chondromyces sp.]|nr:matrixin family metalloprotease [Chondromyces sp.]
MKKLKSDNLARVMRLTWLFLIRDATSVTLEGMVFVSSRIAAVVLAVMSAGLVGAATIIAPADPGELAEQSQGVFLARALGSKAVRTSHVSTVTEFVVVETIKGALTSGVRVTVVVPGGQLEDEIWFVPGSPSFAEGEIYLIFADQGGDGWWRPRLLAESVLRRELGSDGGKVLVPVEESVEVESLPVPGAATILFPGVIKERPFIDALAQRLGGRRGWDWEPLVDADSAASAAVKAAPAGCAFMQSGSTNFRWRSFDTGGSITMWAGNTADSSISGGGYVEVQDALGRWNAVPSTSIDVLYGGPGSAAVSCTSGNNDYVSNTVIFNDPCNDIADLSGCSGTLAYGGVGASGTHTFDGATWYSLNNWYVVVNNGAGCLGSTNYEIMLTHELGHGLGFGHTSDPASLMFPSCCHPHNTLDNTCAQYL